MNSSNRRTFIKTAGAGAAAAGAAALIPAASATVAAGSATVAPAAAAVPALALPAEASGSMVAYIHDVKSGVVSVMVEGREVQVTDHQLVAKLAHAIHSTSKV